MLSNSKYNLLLMQTKINIYLFLLCCCLLSWSCLNNSNSNSNSNIPSSISIDSIPNSTTHPTSTIEKVNSENSQPPIIERGFDRTEIKKHLQEKIAQNKALVVQVFVPLCDNEHQGIVPVSKLLGNGFDLKNNLYWGAKYGLKNHFKQLKGWKYITGATGINDTILERVSFRKQFANGATVLLVLDAYRGDQMKACLEDFLQAASGNSKVQIAQGESTTQEELMPDLVVFNGHNGLMDTQVAPVQRGGTNPRDAAIIACASNGYFKDHLARAHAYPLLTTTNFMAPEAYVVAALIDAWALQKEETAIRKEAGKAYHKYQKCGIRGATNLFEVGW